MPSPVLAATVTDGYGHATSPKNFECSQSIPVVLCTKKHTYTQWFLQERHISMIHLGCVALRKKLNFSWYDQFPPAFALSEAYWDMTIDDSGMIYMVDWYKIRQRPRWQHLKVAGVVWDRQKLRQIWSIHQCSSRSLHRRLPEHGLAVLWYQSLARWVKDGWNRGTHVLSWKKLWNHADSKGKTDSKHLL